MKTSPALRFLWILSAWLLPAFGLGTVRGEEHGEPLLMVVMDPLAAPLSCPCVEGYAQRKYETLELFLERELGQPFELAFGESLERVVASRPNRKPAVVIGKDSVVVAGAQAAGLSLRRVAALSGKDGAVTQTGLILVAAGDPAAKVEDLKGYRLFFGTADCDEKYAAALELLRSAGVPVPQTLETSAACSEGACKLLELRGKQPAAAVISSYARPLLEGCGTVKRGDLRVLAETRPVPFVTAFVDAQLDPSLQRKIRDCLLRTGDDAALCKALESLIGFLPPEEDLDRDPVAKKKR